MEVVNPFRNGLSLYRRGEWKRGVVAFQEALRLKPRDRISSLYLERCSHLKQNPTEKDWQGVWVLTSK